MSVSSLPFISMSQHFPVLLSACEVLSCFVFSTRCPLSSSPRRLRPIYRLHFHHFVLKILNIVIRERHLKPTKRSKLHKLRTALDKLQPGETISLKVLSGKCGISMRDITSRFTRHRVVFETEYKSVPGGILCLRPARADVKRTFPFPLNDPS